MDSKLPEIVTAACLGTSNPISRSSPGPVRSDRPRHAFEGAVGEFADEEPRRVDLLMSEAVTPPRMLPATAMSGLHCALIISERWAVCDGGSVGRAAGRVAAVGVPQVT